MTGKKTQQTTQSNIFGDWLEAYRQMSMPVPTYLSLVLAPSKVFALVSMSVPFVIDAPVVVAIASPALGLLVLLSAIVYPKIEIDRRRVGLEKQYHLVVTHMTVLSTTNINRMEVFRTIASEPEYGELATEFRRIVELVDTWNQSLDEACRRRSKVVPSDHIGDFLERLSYTLDAGQPLGEFLLSEQSVMIEKYETVYENTLSNLETLKDIYLSMLMSMTFALVFAVVLPLLTGTNPTVTTAIVLVVFVFVQLGFFVAIRSMVPYDPVWYHPESFQTITTYQASVITAVGAGLALMIVLGFAGSLAGFENFQRLFRLDVLPEPVYLALPLTPLLLPGVYFYYQERAIIDRDGEFPTFIRALGSAESAKQSTTSRILRTLRRKDFGSLTENIEHLYRRLNMRLDDKRAWRFFAAETNSYLIQKFSEMYLIARQLGGDPKQLGDLIGRNMTAINQLREKRRRATITLIGVLYGLTAAMTFAFFVGIEIVKLLSGMDINIDAAGLDFAQLVYIDQYNLEVITYLIYLVLLFNALLSSLLIRTADGGHKANAYLHFVLLVWISVVTAVLTTSVVSSFLNV